MGSSALALAMSVIVAIRQSEKILKQTVSKLILLPEPASLTNL
jgi:hypothetical protein